jgi:photosystem II stability/assembly factor-like uncharacterized protein
VRFVDQNHGWLGLDDGLLATSDGGQTWRRQLGGTSVGRLWAFDTKHAWALTTGNVLYRTEDGLSWEPTQRTDAGVTLVQFVTPALGWSIQIQRLSTASGQYRETGTLLSSTDGGASWRSISDRPMTSACFLDERNGWGADGKEIFKTADAGHTWTLATDLAIADQGPWYPTIRCSDQTNARVQITEPYAALGHAPYLIYRTSNGGKSWVLEFREAYTLGQTTPTDTPQLGSYPSLFEPLADGGMWFVTCTPPAHTQDFLVIAPSGAVTTRAVVPFASCISDASFVDAQHGWVIGPEFHNDRTESVVVRTIDGGRTWDRLTTP